MPLDVGDASGGGISIDAFLRENPDVSDEYYFWKNVVKLDEPTRGGIHYYMGIKIRYILTKIYASEGFPFRRFYYVGYPMGLGLFMPMNQIPENAKTMEKWRSHYNWNFRYVVLSEIPDDWVGGILDSLTVVSFGLIPLFRSIASEIDIIAYPVYENLAFKNTINDELIRWNWDFIRADLNKRGY